MTEETLHALWNRIARSVFVKFRSTTGALIVLRVQGGEPFAYKLDDTWFRGRYVPVGFSRTAIDATTFEDLPLTDVDEALARIRR